MQSAIGSVLALLAWAVLAGWLLMRSAARLKVD
jgi:hypothetical protein